MKEHQAAAPARRAPADVHRRLVAGERHLHWPLIGRERLKHWLIKQPLLALSALARREQRRGHIDRADLGIKISAHTVQLIGALEQHLRRPWKSMLWDMDQRVIKRRLRRRDRDAKVFKGQQLLWITTVDDAICAAPRRAALTLKTQLQEPWT